METVVNEYRTCKEGRGLSTDPKPTDWDNEENDIWRGL